LGGRGMHLDLAHCDGRRSCAAPGMHLRGCRVLSRTSVGSRTRAMTPQPEPRGRPENAPQRVGSAAWAAAEGGLQRTCWGGLRRLSTEGAAGALSVGHGWCVGPRQAAMSSARRRTLQLGWSHAPAAGGTHRWKLTGNLRRDYSSRPQREAALAALWAAAAAQASQRQLRGSTIRSVCYRSSVTHS
jgi:hypothetical protein